MIILGGKLWSEDEVIKLIEMSDKLKTSTIAKSLGRTEEAVKKKLMRLNISTSINSIDAITVSNLASICKVGGGRVRTWIKKGLKTTKFKKYKSSVFTFIKIEDFWDFAEKNKDLINFANIDRNILGREPDWVREKRLNDIKYSKKKNARWTKKEDDVLRRMYKYYSLKEIREVVGRTEEAISIRIRRLGLKRRVVIRWSDKEIKMLLKMKKKGMSENKIAIELGRSSGSVNKKYKELVMEGIV